jgi:hypothetical protein
MDPGRIPDHKDSMRPFDRDDGEASYPLHGLAAAAGQGPAARNVHPQATPIPARGKRFRAATRMHDLVRRRPSARRSAPSGQADKCPTDGTDEECGRLAPVPATGHRVWVPDTPTLCGNPVAGDDQILHRNARSATPRCGAGRTFCLSPFPGRRKTPGHQLVLDEVHPATRLVSSRASSAPGKAPARSTTRTRAGPSLNVNLQKV